MAESVTDALAPQDAWKVTVDLLLGTLPKRNVT